MIDLLDLFGDRILVRPDKQEADQMTESGLLYIPDTALDEQQTGEVLAVGPGKTFDDGEVRPVCVEKGDRVLFGKYSGIKVPIDGEELFFLYEADIICRIRNGVE